MKLVSTGNQQVQHPLYVADITMSGSAQLVLARSMSRSSVILQNLGANSIAIEIGSARGTATITNGAVTSIAVTNAGFGFSKAPVIRLEGGGYAGNSSYLGLGQPGGASPNNMNGIAGRPATAHCVMTGSAPNMTVASITVDDGGAGYITAPYVYIFNDDLDPNGAAVPALASKGFILPTASGPVAWNGTTAPTESISAIGTNGDVLLARWMD